MSHDLWLTQSQLREAREQLARYEQDILALKQGFEEVEQSTLRLVHTLTQARFLSVDEIEGVAPNTSLPEAYALQLLFAHTNFIGLSGVIGKRSPH